MKKTVFLLLLTSLLLFTSEHKVLGSSAIYVVNNKEFIVRSIEENGMKGFAIEKTGVNPFYSEVIDEDENYYITGMKEIENYYILFGYGFTNERETEYDSLIIVLDYAGNTIHKDLRDYGSMETVKDIFYIDDVLISYTESVDDIDYSYQFSSNFFTAFDYNFNYENSIEIRDKIYMTESNDSYILIAYDKEEYDLGIRSDLSLIKKTDILSIIEGHVYTDPLTIDFINGATLNDEYVENGLTVSYPGNYIINYNNKIYNFIMKAKIEGVSDGKIYSESVSPVISGGNVMLNNDIFVSNTEISSPGNYNLSVNGVNNYKEDIDFTITSNLTGVTNNNIYHEALNIQFNGVAYLNDNYIQSPHEITENGEYILKINGENDYQESYYFSLQDDVKKAGLVDFVQKVDIIVLVLVLIAGVIIIKKK